MISELTSFGRTKRGGGFASSSFCVFVILAILFPLIFFNALPSDQYLLFPLVLLLIILFGVRREPFLLANTIGWRLNLVIWMGPLYLITTPFLISFWPWLSLWMGVSLLLLPLGFLATYSLRVLRADYFFLAYSLVAVINALAVIWLSLNGVFRPAGFFQDPNLAADVFAIGILVTIFLVNFTARKWMIYLQALLFIAVFLTLSRGALISLVGALVVFFGLCKLLSFQIFTAFLKTIFVACISFLIAWLIQADPSSTSGFSLTERPESMQDRLDMWLSTWTLFKEYPLWGTGLGSFSLRYPAVRALSETTSSGYYAHNDYLQLLAELGVFGFLCYVALPFVVLFLLIRACFQRRGSCNYPIIVIAISSVSLVSAHSAINFVIYHPLVSLFVGSVLGFSAREIFTEKSRTDSLEYGKGLFIQRSIFSVLFGIVLVSSVSDLYARKLVSDAGIEGRNFSLQSETYYRLLAVSYFSPLNVEVRNYLIAAQVNTSLNLLPSQVGKALIDEIQNQVSDNSWLQWGNCSQKVSKARLVWFREAEEAISELELLLDKVPNCIQGRITLAEAYLAQSEYEEAIQLLNEGINRFAFRENRGEGPVILIETLIQAYRYDGREGSALALEAYLESFKRKRAEEVAPKWRRSIDL